MTMSILLAEDDIVSAEILKGALTDWGYEVICVDNGKDALEVLEKPNAPKIAILDWEMPLMNGLEICRKIRNREQGSYVYILLLTGKSERDEVVEGLQAGADDYITKPFDPQELKLRISGGERIICLETELIKLLSQLKDSEEGRRNFISALTHDLRTPLMAEKRALEVIHSCKGEISSRLGVLTESLSQNNEDLLKLVNQLLESYQYEESEISLSEEAVNINTMITDCFLKLSSLADSKQIRLVNNSPKELNGLFGDRYQLNRLFTNLISNAINNIPESSFVEVTAKESDDFIEILIQDNGQGISPELLPHLFERYHSGSRSSQKLGSGLGLSICKTIIELHQGRIQVESEQGQGTKFYIYLPKQLQNRKTLEDKPLNVLIVEDQELARVGLKLTLQGLNCFRTIDIAENGQQALEQIKKNKPDIILMDIIMPVMDGVTATQKIKTLYPDIKVIMFTSIAQSKEVNAALASGADAYCMKDIKTNLLVNAIEQTLNGQKWLDPNIAEFIEQTFQEIKSEPKTTSQCGLTGMAQDRMQSNQLTERELQVLRLISLGKTNQEMAYIFHTSLDSVNDHINQILTKLEASDKVKAAEKAKEQGLLLTLR